MFCILMFSANPLLLILLKRLNFGWMFTQTVTFFFASVYLLFSFFDELQVLFCFFNLYFYWRIIALQNFVVFCQTSTWISHRYMYIYIYPLPLEPPSCLPPHPTPLGWYQAPLWVSWAIQQIPVGYFTYGNVSFHVTLSIRLTLSSPLPLSISLFSMSVSPLLPCK